MKRRSVSVENKISEVEMDEQKIESDLILFFWKNVTSE